MNRAIRCPNGILVSMCLILLDVLFVVYESEMKGPRFTRVRSKNVEALNGALRMTQNLAERVDRLCPKSGLFPWLFPSQDLDYSQSELATVQTAVEILYASSRDRICLWKAIRRKI